MRIALVCLLLAQPALALSVLTTSAMAAETVRSDDWYAVYVNGTKSGHARTRVIEVSNDDAPTAPSHWQTDSETLIVVSKGGSDIELVLRSNVLEAPDGRVTLFRQSSDVGGQAVEMVGRVVAERIKLDQNGVTGEVAYPVGAVGPAETDRRVAKSGFEPGATTEVLTFATDYPGEGARMTFSVGEPETLHVIDRNLHLHRVSVTNPKSASRTMTMWMDGTARMHVSESDVPGIGRLRMVRTTEKLARAATSAADIGTTALVVPDRGIAAPRRSKKLVVRLSREDGADVGDWLIEDDQQRIGELREDGARDITIAVPTVPEGLVALRRPVKDEAMAPFLARSAYLETDDAGVRDLAERAVGDETDALVCARRIEDLVRAYVNEKSMDVGFATAAEVARSREGDCTEHAVLAAAIARAAGLPSRVVTGIVYVPAFSTAGVGPRGAFGYHMWAEVLVAKDRWHPVDAALGGFDATHVAVAKSDLSATSPSGRLYLPLMEATSGLRIQVLETE